MTMSEPIEVISFETYDVSTHNRACKAMSLTIAWRFLWTSGAPRNRIRA